MLRLRERTIVYLFKGDRTGATVIRRPGAGGRLAGARPEELERKMASSTEARVARRCPQLASFLGLSPWSSALLFAAGLLAFTQSAEGRLPLPIAKRLCIERQEEADYLYPADLDGDGRDEVIRSIRPPGLYTIMVHDLEHRCISSVLNSTDSLWLHRCSDIDDDGNKELFFASRRGDSAFVAVYDRKLTRPALAEFRAAMGKDIRPPGGWDGRVDVCGLVDVDGDGGIDIVGSIVVGFDLYPRGISTYDWTSGREIWHFPMGANPTDVTVADLDGVDGPEVVVATFAPANGADSNETDDSHSYAIVLSSTGRLRWKREIGGVYSNLISSVGNVDEDGFLEVVVAERGEENRPEGHRLLVLDGKTGDIERQLSLPKKFLGIEVEDLDGDGRDEIVVGNVDGRLRVLDGSLRVISEYVHPASVELRRLVDLDGDGISEMLLSTGDGWLLVLNHRLREVVRFEVGEPYWHMLPVSEGRERKLLLGKDGLWRWMRIEDRKFMGLNLVWLAISGYAIGFLLLVALSIATSRAVVVRRRKRVVLPPVDVLRAVEDDFIHEGKKKLATLRTGLMELESGQATEGLTDVCRESFADFQDKYETYKAKLELLGSRGRLISVRINQSLEVLRKSLASVGDPRVRARVLGPMIAAADALSQDVGDKLWDEVKRYKYDVADALREAIAAVRLEKERDMGVFSIAIKEELPEGPSPKDIYYEDFREWKHIFSNLIRNAVEATVRGVEEEAIGPERRVVTVSLSRTFEKGWKDVVVIEDRACGMDEETKANFWRRGYSRGKAGSMGVGVTPETIEFIRRHGHLSIESEVGKGTKLTIQAGLKGG